MSKQKLHESVPADTTVVETLLRSLSVVEDPRNARGKRYLLIEVLTIAVLGCMCGCDHAEALEDWGRKEHDWLAGFLALEHGTPGQDVFLRVLAAVDPEQFRAAFQDWMQQVFGALGIQGQIAVDGQTHRGSRDRGQAQSPVHVVHALACEQGLVLGQTATEKKSNEIIAIPALLKMLEFQGALVSIDAMGCQKKIARQIVDQGGDYLLGLKGNQSNLHQQVIQTFEEALDPGGRTVDEAKPPAVETATDVDGGHGRIETRCVQILRNADNDFESWIPMARNWPELKSAIAVVATREDAISGKTSTETRYYISSRELTPEEANRAVRSHWLVENQLHWVLDVSFGQDKNQTRTKNAVENLAVVRHFALNLVRNYSGDRYSMPRRRRLCDYDADYRTRILSEAVS